MAKRNEDITAEVTIALFGNILGHGKEKCENARTLFCIRLRLIHDSAETCLITKLLSFRHFAICIDSCTIRRPLGHFCES